MPIVTNHPNAEVDSVDFNTILDSLPDALDIPTDLGKLDDLISKLTDSNNRISSEKLIGEGTLEDGGLVGSLLHLLRAHSVASLKSGELTKANLGEVYSGLLNVATDTAVKMLTSSSTELQTATEALSRAIMAKISINEEVAKLQYEKYKVAGEAYKLEVLNPLTREQLKETNEKLHIDHEIAKYTYDYILPEDLGAKVKNNSLLDINYKEREYSYTNILPLDKSIKDKQIDDMTVGTSIKEYNLSDMLPTDKEIKLKQIDDLAKDTSIKDYNLTNILPADKDMKLKQTQGIEKDTSIKDYNLTNILPLDKSMKEDQIADLAKETEIKSYNLTNILPLDKNFKTNQVADLAKDTAIKDFNLTNLLPLDESLKNNQISDLAKSTETKAYNLSDILPAQKDKLLADNGLVTQNTTNAATQNDILGIEKLIKDYYHTNIQPEEYSLSKAKAFIEEVNAGEYVVADSLPYKKMQQIDVQTSLYDRQIGTYDDVKYQKLLNTIMNYNSMIFPDNTATDKLLPWAVDHTNSLNIYNTLMG